MSTDEIAGNGEPFGGAMSVIERHRDLFQSDPGILGVRPGLLQDNESQPRPGIFVVRHPGAMVSDLPKELEGFSVVIVDASIHEQLEGVLPPKVWEGMTQEADSPPTISYRSPEPVEVELKECHVSKIKCHVGPDSGWATLKPFLEATTHSLTVAMYEFYADHIVKFVADLGKSPQLSMDMILQVSKNDDDIESSMRQTWGDRFQLMPASVSGPNRIFNNSYHTKVAVRDSKSMWLSSGNWSPTSQPFIEPTVTRNFYNKGNREWHVIIEDENLSQIFEKFIKYDIKMASLVNAGKIEKALPDLFVPESLLEEREAAITQLLPFSASEIGSAESPIRIKPLLSPDNYATEILRLINSASKSLYLQFSYIRQPSRGRFDEIIDAISQKMKDGVDVRILVGKTQDKGHSDLLIELRSWDPQKFRRQTSNLHNKGILVDGKVAVVGSNNWSTDGTQYNRDASLIIYSEAVAKYFGDVFLFDWDYLSRSIISESEAAPVIAREGQPTTEGMVRVPWNEWFE